VIALTSASVGLRKVSRSVSSTQLLGLRKVGVGKSCSILEAPSINCSTAHAL
jgi:hypothetical protein